MLKFSLVQNTKVLAGCGTAAQTGEILKEAGYKKAFLVFDAGVKAANAYIIFRDEVLKLKSIKEYNLDYSNIDGIEDAVVNEPFAGLCPMRVTKENVAVMIKEVLDI